MQTQCISEDPHCKGYCGWEKSLQDLSCLGFKGLRLRLRVLGFEVRVKAVECWVYLQALGFGAQGIMQ